MTHENKDIRRRQQMEIFYDKIEEIENGVILTCNKITPIVKAGDLIPINGVYYEAIAIMESEEGESDFRYKIICEEIKDND